MCINNVFVSALNFPALQSKVTHQLTHWGRVEHICVSKLSIIGSDNGLAPGWLQAIIWTNDGILLIGPLGTNFSKILIEIQTFSLKKIRLKMSSEKCCSFRLSLNVLKFNTTRPDSAHMYGDVGSKSQTIMVNINHVWLQFSAKYINTYLDGWMQSLFLLFKTALAIKCYHFSSMNLRFPSNRPFVDTRFLCSMVNSTWSSGKCSNLLQMKGSFKPGF